MFFLRQSTANQSVLLGVFVDATDGATAETGLTIANTDIRLSKNGGNMAAKNSGGGTHDEDGWYTITLDATDTNTVGRLQVSCKVSGALAAFMEFQVLEEAIFDALFAADAAGFDSNQRVDVGSWLGTAVTVSATSAKPQVDIDSIDDDATAADNLEAAYDGTGYDVGGIDVSELNTAVDAIGSDGTGLTEAGGDGDHLTEAGGTGDQFTALNDLSAAEVNAEVDSALDTAIPGSPTSGSINEAIKRLNRSVGVIQEFTVDHTTFTATTTAAQVDAVDIDSLEATDDHYIGRVIIFTSGALKHQATTITDYDGTNKRFTYDELTEAPADDVTFIVV